jgi:pimeloyl-ACP methyl ester carboxylesterase
MPPIDVPIPQPKDVPKGLPRSVQLGILVHPERNQTNYVPFENAIDYPFVPDANTWSRVNSWWLAEASWLAYSHDEAAVRKTVIERAGMQSCELIDEEGTECYVMSRDEFAIVAFRGTQPDDWHDLFDIARFEAVEWDVGHVHDGFKAALEAVWDPLEDALDALAPECAVWFTGHSLGAALATLAAYRYRDRAAGVCTFGSPRTGNGVLAGHFDAVFEERSIRYVNDHDAVTHVPPDIFALPHGLYTHVDHLRWINKDGQIGTTQPTLLHFVRDVFGSSNVLLDLINLAIEGATLELPDALTDHTPLFYALHCWNDFAIHYPQLGPAIATG